MILSKHAYHISPYQAKNQLYITIAKFCVPLTSVQLEFSATYMVHNDRQDTSYVTIPMMSCDEQVIVAFLPRIRVKIVKREAHL